MEDKVTRSGKSYGQRQGGDKTLDSGNGDNVSEKGTVKSRSVVGSHRSCSVKSKSSEVLKKEESIRTLEQLATLEEEEVELQTELKVRRKLIHNFEKEIVSLEQDLEKIPAEDEEQLKKKKADIDWLKQSKLEKQNELDTLDIKSQGRLKVIAKKKHIIQAKGDVAKQIIDEEFEQDLSGIDLTLTPEVPDRTKTFVDMSGEQAIKCAVALKAAEKEELESNSEKSRLKDIELEDTKRKAYNDEIERKVREQELAKQAEADLKKIELQRKLEVLKMKAEIALSTAKTKAEEDKKQQEILDRQAAEATAELMEMEEGLRSTTEIEPPPNTGTASHSKPKASAVTGEDRLIELFAQAIQKSAGSNASEGQRSIDNSKFLARQSNYAKDLPNFSGKAEEWPIFSADFERSTKDCGYSNSENMSRLRKCLKGDAAKFVQSLMVAPDNVPTVIKKLEIRYGQPELIIESMILKAKEIPAFKDEQLDMFIEFGSAVQNVIATIQTLKRPGHLSNPQLLKEFETKLPRTLMMQWLNWVDCKETRVKDLVHFAEWLDKQTTLACQACPPTLFGEDKTKELPPKKKSTLQANRVRFEEDLPTAAGLFVGEKHCCIFCAKHSSSTDCRKAEGIPWDDKCKLIQEKRCCYKCLNVSHFARDCRAIVKCRHCEKAHPSCMCYGILSNQNRPQNRPQSEPRSDSSKPTVSQSTVDGVESFESSSCNLACSSKVMLKTLMVTVFGRFGKKSVRALIDDGAQRSYILKKLAEDLGLSPTGEEKIRHVLFGGVCSDVIKHRKYAIKLMNAVGNGTSTINVLDKEKICEELPRLSSGAWLKELRTKGIWFSDIGDEREEIQILIGADMLAGLTTEAPAQHLKNGLLALNTVLGWTLMGSVSGEKSESSSVAMTVTDLLNSQFTPNQKIQHMWSLEAIGIEDPEKSKSKEEQDEIVKSNFLKTVSRNKQGRFVVGLPWIDGRPTIPDNKATAVKRLESTSKRLEKNGQFSNYGKIFENWADEDFIEEVPECEWNQQSHYIPHRPVFKPESTTTPIRPVFDASCKSGRNPSLNECLEKGPNMAELIPSILLRFREKMFGVISDIRKAFQMIEVVEEDRDYLRFLWWEGPDQKKLKVYRHKRVVFGVNCSPFLLAAVLEYILTRYIPKDEEEMAQILLKSLYVDNCVTSFDSLEEVKVFQDWATDVLAAALMDLREWEAGVVEKSGIGPLISGCGLDFGRNVQKGIGKKVTSVLGYKWNKVNDTLHCEVAPFAQSEKLTKRTVLSHLQKVYDPIGFTCPATLQPKLLIQRLWTSKLGWDEDLPEEDRREFMKWESELQCLAKIEIPRNFTGGISDRKNWQVHVFSDASKYAYATVVFLRVDVNGEITVQLLAAKARVAPLQKMTINRLELLGCFIGATLSDSVKKALELDEVPFYFWSDSSTALAWIRRNDEWGTFVGNRVRTICSITVTRDWRHVPGRLNPADLPSRGCTPMELEASKWWEGPEWLKGPEESWPSEESPADEDSVVTERKKTSTKVAVMNATEKEHPWYARKSCFKKNVTTMSWVLRFVRLRFVNLLRKGKSTSFTNAGVLLDILDGHKEKDTDQLTVDERDYAELVILRLVQRDSLPIKDSVISGITVEKKEDGLVHVKTRVIHRNDTFGYRYPILLPHSHVIVDQIIRKEHAENKHAGVQVLMGNLREKYWIIQGRKAIRRNVTGCVICRRYTVRRQNVEPAPLPEDRVKAAKVFENVGVDLAGPLYMKGRDKKAWIVIFTCAVYRCLHLEVVKSLSTEDFMDAFSRFIALRGRPSVVYSDNGTNFVGAENALKDLDWEKITKEHGIQKIRWKFNPPATPWWGGWWERMVRMVKELLRRALGRAKINYEKLTTCIYEVAAIINKRPLCVVTEDPHDLVPLTPAMFLHETEYPSVSDQELLDQTGLQKLCENRMTFLEDIKTRFRREYLAQLVHKGKNKTIREFAEGDVVLLGYDNKKRLDWTMARIVELLPGKDGKVRLVKVKTAGKVILTPIQLLYPLEASSPLKNSDGFGEGALEQVVTRAGRKVKAPERYKP